MFSRVGEGTDVVRKEMYDFLDKGGRHLALRPEGTASVARAFVEHRPPTPWKVWYAAPSFRYERAQANRYRQHHQLGARGHRQRRSRPRRRGHRAAGRLLRQPRAAPGRARHQLHRHAGRSAPATSTTCARSWWDGSASSTPTTRRRSRATRCGCSTPSVRPASRSWPTHRCSSTTCRAEAVAHFERVQAGLDRARHPFPHRAAARARPRLLHPHRLRVSVGRPRRGPEHHRRRRPLRRPRRVARRPVHPRHRLRHRHRADAWPRATPKVCSTPAAGRCRRLRRSTPPAATPPATSPSSCAARHRRRAGLRRRWLQVAGEAGPPLWRRVLVIVRPDGDTGEQLVVRPLRPGHSGDADASGDATSTETSRADVLTAVQRRLDRLPTDPTSCEGTPRDHRPRPDPRVRSRRGRRTACAPTTPGTCARPTWAAGGGVRLGGPPARARRAPRLHRRARPHRHRAVRGRRSQGPAQRVRGARRRHGADRGPRAR